MKILVSSSMKLFSQLVAIKERLEELGHVVELPDKGADSSGDNFKRRMIDIHIEKLKRADALLLANIGGRIGASTFFEAGWAFALNKPIFSLEMIDSGSDYAEDLRAVGVVELNGDLNAIKEVSDEI